MQDIYNLAWVLNIVMFAILLIIVLGSRNKNKSASCEYLKFEPMVTNLKDPQIFSLSTDYENSAEIQNEISTKELLEAFNSGETIEDGLEEVFRLGQKHHLAK